VPENSSQNDLPVLCASDDACTPKHIVGRVDNGLMGNQVNDRTTLSHEMGKMSQRPANDIAAAVRTDAPLSDAKLNTTVLDVHSYVEVHAIESYTASVSSEVALGLEPDIVQSTKSSSLTQLGNLPHPRPVAPPRKKKGPAPLPPSSGATDEVFIELYGVIYFLFYPDLMTYS